MALGEYAVNVRPPSGDHMSVRTKRDEEIERLIRQTEVALAYSRLFLDQLEASNTAAREQIGRFVEDLKLRIVRLKREIRPTT
jgi:hypothetical protein